MNQAHPPSRRADLDLSRRGFLAASGSLAAAGFLSQWPAAQTVAAQTQAAKPEARNLILLVADGMSLGTLSLGNLFAQLRDGRSSHWLKWINSGKPRTSLIDTHSANALVTDSAASASAWSIGQRVDNRAISFTPDGQTPTPLFVRAKQSGRAIGLVTNTAMWDATTAAFVANAPRREMHEPIAQMMCEAAPDLMLGGGADVFTDQLLAAHPLAKTIHTRDELWHDHDPRTPLVGLFAGETFNFAFERTTNEPTVAEMLQVALHRLSQHPSGFTLVLEESLVDHAAHLNDAGSLVRHQLEFEDAVQLAIEFVQGRDDTLLIATTDHANANPGLTIYDEQGERLFRRLLTFNHSISWMIREIRAFSPAERTVHSVAPIIESASGIQLSEMDRNVLARALERQQVDPFLERNDEFSSTLGSILANHCGVAFVSPNHTSDHVIATAAGPGSERMMPIMHITELHSVMVQALGLPPSD